MCHSCASSSPGNREFYSFLDSRFRGNDTPHPAWPLARPASPARGEAICFIRLKCYLFFTFRSFRRKNGRLIEADIEEVETFGRSGFAGRGAVSGG